jgi:carbon storage regulator CsrA
MLVITRKAQQTIVVGDTVFTVLRIQGGAVRIGIQAPKEVRILRGELVAASPKETRAEPMCDAA